MNVDNTNLNSKPEGCDLCSKSFNSEEQRNQHLQSKNHLSKQAKLDTKGKAVNKASQKKHPKSSKQAKRRKKGEAVNKASQEEPDFSNWSSKPLWSKKHLTIFEDIRSQVRVMAQGKDEAKRLLRLRDFAPLPYHKQPANWNLTCVAKEMQKGLNEKNVEELWGMQEDLQVDFQKLFNQRWNGWQQKMGDWLRVNNDWRVFSSSAFPPSPGDPDASAYGAQFPPSPETAATTIIEKLLQDNAKECNVTTTSYGNLVAGTKAMTLEFEAAKVVSATKTANDDTSEDLRKLQVDWQVQIEKLGEEQATWKKRVAMTAVELASSDFVDGSKFRDAKPRTKTDKAGRKGESELEKELGKAGISKDKFMTEKEQKIELPGVERKKVPTPDILFHDPVEINGRIVKWIDAKKCLLLPGVSAAKEEKNKVEQMAKYTKKFGPGAILWLKSGFCESIVDIMGPDVAHFTIEPLTKFGQSSDQVVGKSEPASRMGQVPLGTGLVPPQVAPIEPLTKSDRNSISAEGQHLGAPRISGQSGPVQVTYLWTPRREEKAGMDGATAAQPPRAKKNEMAADAAEKRMRDEKVTGAEGEIS